MPTEPCASRGIQRFWSRPDAPSLATIERALGLELWDVEGRRYLDVTSGPVAVNLGHGNPHVLRALQAQAERVCFSYPSAFASEADARLSALLATHAGFNLDHAFYCSGGTEAVEKCLQFARRHALATGATTRHKIISREPCYHGSTEATMRLAADPGYAAMLPEGSRGIHVPVPWSYRAPATLSAEDYALDCAEALRERIRAEGPDTVLAFILEPVMGFSGGADFAPACYYERVRAICDEFGVLMVYDEIMTGVGRTGRFLAAHWWPQARPDLVVLAKGLGSGYVPLSAFLAPGHMVEAVVSGTGFHLGHTHKAQPLACAVGLAVIEQILEQDLITNATTQGMRLRIGLRNLAAELPIVGHVRGLGLLNAIEIVADRERKTRLPLAIDPVARIQRLAREQGLLVYARRTHAGRHGDWVMVAPPLIATASDVDAILDGLGRTLRAFTDELARDGYLTAR